MSSQEVAESLPGFRPLSKQIYVQDADATAKPASASDPTTILIFGWGDSRPRPIAKYVVGYRALFPAAQIVVVFAPIAQTLLQGTESRKRAMMPLAQAVFSEIDPSRRVLIHGMSNTGVINSASLFDAFQALHPGEVLAHPLLVTDSAPGNPNVLANLWTYAHALSIGLKKAGVPVWISQPLAAVFLALNQTIQHLFGAETGPEHTLVAFSDKARADPAARRLYIYSKEDEIIPWRYIEEYVAKVRQDGWEVETAMFKGSGHCAHLRADPDRYWNLIQANWEAAVGGQGRNRAQVSNAVRRGEQLNAKSSSETPSGASV
jgi:hypothetical protein